MKKSLHDLCSDEKNASTLKTSEDGPMEMFGMSTVFDPCKSS